MIINEINRGNSCFLFDAEGEYEKLVRKNKGEYIDMYSSSGGIINPLQVRFLPSDKEEKEDGDINSINYEDCPLAKHLGSLETFIKCAFEEIKESEVVVMLDMIEKLYKRFGITKNGFEDYHNYLPSLTLSASFPLTITHFNDETYC